MRSVEKCPWCSDDPEATQFHQLCQREAAIYACRVREQAPKDLREAWDRAYKPEVDPALNQKMSEFAEACGKLTVGIVGAHRLFKQSQSGLYDKAARSWDSEVQTWLNSNWPMHNAHYESKKMLLEKTIQDSKVPTP